VILFRQGELADANPPRAGPVECKQRLGGLLKFYYRKAACNYEQLKIDHHFAAPARGEDGLPLTCQRAARARFTRSTPTFGSWSSS